MNKITTMLKGFSMMSLLFVATIFVERVVELVMAWSSGIHIESFHGILWTNLAACGVQIMLVFAVFSLLFFLSDKLARIIAAVLFGLFAFTELGLVIYYHSTGLIMGKELIYRPLWETVFTIRSYLNPVLIAVVIVVFIAYIFLLIWVSNKKCHRIIPIFVLFAIMVSIPNVIFSKQKSDEYVVNKTWYCCVELLSGDAAENAINEVVVGEVKSHDEYLAIYQEMFPNRQVVDYEYPLERYDNTTNVLGPYFKTSDTKPDIVMIIVESLGSDLFGINDYGLCYTPFLDSLSRSSLLWTNCLSTTPRSFGAIPAITGSVPHGLRGFQFGEIPNHNSLMTILKDNGYNTSVFYAGLFTFDKVYDYLVAQKTDYLSPFYEEFKNDKSDDKDGDFWGYNDKTMFEKSLDVIGKRQNDDPNFDMFVTITQHEKLSLTDKHLNDYYYGKAKDIMSGLPKKARKKEKNNLGKLAATVYADDALRCFFNKYRQMHNDDNTIFIITGDHNMGLKKDTYLDAYHVPLIIWSPLLTTSCHFKSLVSHDDITPSIVALMRDNFGAKTPETVHWMSDGLDTATSMKSDYKGYFFTYSIHPVAFVYDDLFMDFKNGEKAYKIGDSLKLSEADSVDLALYKERFDALVYIDNYVYSNNKLIKKPIISSSDFKIVKEFELTDSVFCATNAEKPSAHTPDTLFFFNEKIDGMHSVMKVVVNADIRFTKQLPIHHFINIGMRCSGDKMDYTEFSDCVSKYIKSYDYQENRWEKMELSMMFSTNDSDAAQLEMYLVPARWDEWWDPEHTVTLKNIVVEIMSADE